MLPLICMGNSADDNKFWLTVAYPNNWCIEKKLVWNLLERPFITIFSSYSWSAVAIRFFLSLFSDRRNGDEEANDLRRNEDELSTTKRSRSVDDVVACLFFARHRQLSCRSMQWVNTLLPAAVALLLHYVHLACHACDLSAIIIIDGE